MHRCTLAFGLSATLFALAACSGESARAAAPLHPDGYETLELRYQGSASQVVFPELAEELGYLAPLKLKYVGNTISGPQDIQSVATRDVDFGGAFNGAIVNLVAAKAPIRSVVAISFIDEQSWMGFFVPDGSAIRGGRDLIGKKIGMNTIGAHSEFMLKEYLMREGLRRDEIEQVTLVVIPPVNAEQALRQKQVDVAAMSGILRDKALERGGIHPLVRDYDLFGRLTSASYAMHEDFLREQPKSAAKFVEAVARAIEWSRATPRQDVIAKLEKIVNQRKRNEDTSVIKFWQPSAANLPGGLLSEDQFQVWIDWLVKDGQLPRGSVRATELFTNRFNLYAK
jgi:ABC-type nitrate/sulfonate/bicarbonate transport system substrate-binding protein